LRVHLAVNIFVLRIHLAVYIIRAYKEKSCFWCLQIHVFWHISHRGCQTFWCKGIFRHL